MCVCGHGQGRDACMVYVYPLAPAQCPACGRRDDLFEAQSIEAISLDAPHASALQAALRRARDEAAGAPIDPMVYAPRSGAGE